MCQVSHVSCVSTSHLSEVMRAASWQVYWTAAGNCLNCSAHVCWCCDTQMLTFYDMKTDVVWQQDCEELVQKCAAFGTLCDNTHIQGSRVGLHAVPPLYRRTEMHYSCCLLSYEFFARTNIKAALQKQMHFQTGADAYDGPWLAWCYPEYRP